MDENLKKLQNVLLVVLTVAVCASTWYSYQTNVLLNNIVNGQRPSAPNLKISERYDKGQSLDKAQNMGKPIVVFFYTDWCGASQKLAPIFAKITKKREFKKNFAVAYINCELPENAKYIKEYNIKWFPTVYVINPEKKIKVLINNSEFYSTASAKTLIQKFINSVN